MCASGTPETVRARIRRVRRDNRFSAVQQAFPVCPLSFLPFLLCKMMEAIACGGFSIAIFATQQNTAVRNNGTG
jgi:hypothetical protein